jgi:hypothetical protein
MSYNYFQSGEATVRIRTDVSQNDQKPLKENKKYSLKHPICTQSQHMGRQRGWELLRWPDKEWGMAVTQVENERDVTPRVKVYRNIEIRNHFPEWVELRAVVEYQGFCVYRQ